MPPYDDTSFELISAYLDGELSVDERAQVESLLESSDEHRQLLDDLQSLRTQFESIPRQQAPERLSTRIMDAIADQPAHPSQVESPSKPTTASPTIEHHPRAWTAGLVRLAIAASLLIALWTAYRTMNPVGPKPQDIVSPGPEQNPNEAIVQQQPKVGPEQNDPDGGDPGKIDPLPPEMGFVFQDVASDLLMIFDYTVEPRLLENDTFRNTLKMHGVDVSDTINPDEATQQSILKSAAFGVASPKPGDAKQNRVQFSIVVADLDKLFEISQTLQAVDGVKSMRTDLSVNPADMQMMRALERSRRNQFADSAIGKGRAYFVALGGELQGALLGPAGAVMNLNGLGGMANLAPPQGAPGEPRIMPVAFILRSAE